MVSERGAKYLEKLELLFEYVKSELPPGYRITSDRPGYDGWWDIQTEDSDWGCVGIRVRHDSTLQVGAGYSARHKFTLNVHDPDFGVELHKAIQVGLDDKPGDWDERHPMEEEK